MDTSYNFVSTSLIISAEKHYKSQPRNLLMQTVTRAVHGIKSAQEEWKASIIPRELKRELYNYEINQSVLI